MKKTNATTFERVMKDPKRKAKFEEKYAEFLLSEVLMELMNQAEISVRSLAKQVGISPAVIQDIRSGKRSNITVKSLLGIVTTLGATLLIEKGNKSYSLHPEGGKKGSGVI